MKSAKSVSLDLKVWLAVEKFKEDEGIKDVSSAVEHLLKKSLKGEFR